MVLDKTNVEGDEIGKKGVIYDFGFRKQVGGFPRKGGFTHPTRLKGNNAMCNILRRPDRC
jgi:hypothetical protein